MNVREHSRVAAAVVMAAAVLVATVLWNEMPGSYVECSNDVPAATDPNAPVQPYSIVDCSRVVPISERIVKVLIALLALSGVAFVANSVVAKGKVLTGATACAATAVLALVSLSFVYADVRGELSFPHPVAILTFGITSAIIGAVASWALTKWRPNNSLERTRDR
jgi:hypothetical protein